MQTKDQIDTAVDVLELSVNMLEKALEIMSPPDATAEEEKLLIEECRTLIATYRGH